MRIHIDQTDFNDDMQYTYRGEPFTGELVDQSPDGQVTTLKTVRDGIPNGPEREWYADGTLSVETHVVDGRAVGISRKWHPNGQLAEEREFTDRGRFVACRRWAEDGTPLDEP